MEYLGTPPPFPLFPAPLTFAQQTALMSLFEAFRSDPGCTIKRCITYIITCDAPFSLAHAFHRLPDGTHTLRNELAPTDDAAVWAFVEQRGEDRIPGFEVSFKYGQEGAHPRGLVEVVYVPRLSVASEGFDGVSPAGGIVKCEYDRRQIQIGELYRRASSDGFY